MKRILLLLTICCLIAGCSDSPETETTIQTVPETTLEGQVAMITPLPVIVDLSHLESCSIAVSLDQDGVFVDDTGAMQLQVTVFVYDLYDMADIADLQIGSRILLRGEAVCITSLERNAYGTVLINGGLDAGGFELVTGENTVYFETGYSDMKSWYPLGDVVIPVAPDFLYMDRSDLDAGSKTGPAELLLEENVHYPFTPQEALLTIEDGKAIALHRSYTP